MAFPKLKPGESKDDFCKRCMDEAELGREDAERVFRVWGGEHGKDLQVVRFAEVDDSDMHAKAFSGEDNDAGWIEGYAATFGNVDRQGERMRKGAFKKSIKEKIPAGKIPLMAKHFMYGGGVYDVIGSVTGAKEDDKGLFFHADLSSVPSAQDIRRKVLEGHVKTLSAGFRLIRGEPVKVEGQIVFDLVECALQEATITPAPANELAVITNAKELIGAAESIGQEAPDGRLSPALLARAEEVLQNMQDVEAGLKRLVVDAAKTDPQGTVDIRAALQLAVAVRRRRFALMTLTR